MTLKHDDDNRSNQLNSNNDAYHSSRGFGGRSIGDDEDYGRAFKIRSYPNVRFAPQVPNLIQDKFHIDFITYCGRVFLYELMAEMDCHPTFGTYRGGDCTDVAEFVFHDRWHIIKSENRVQIACSTLSKVGKGLITWVGGRYKPGSRYVHGGNPTEENKALWMTKGARAWQELESKLASGLNVDRIDLGVINGKNLKHFKYRGEA